MSVLRLWRCAQDSSGSENIVRESLMGQENFHEVYLWSRSCQSSLHHVRPMSRKLNEKIHDSESCINTQDAQAEEDKF